MELVFKDYHFFTVSLRLNFVEWLAKKQRLSEFSKDAKFMDKGYGTHGFPKLPQFLIIVL